MEISTVTGQSLLDLAIQGTGSIEGVFRLAEAAGVSITDELSPGMTIPVPLPIADPQVAEYYAARRITPATAITTDNTSGGGDISMEGIGFWAVEYDFIVS